MNNAAKAEKSQSVELQPTGMLNDGTKNKDIDLSGYVTGLLSTININLSCL